jgi:hypothetical protein
MRHRTTSPVQGCIGLGHDLLLKRGAVSEHVTITIACHS